MVAAPFALLCRPNVTFFLYSNQSDNVLAELVPLWVQGREATFAAHSYPLSQDITLPCFPMYFFPIKGVLT